MPSIKRCLFSFFNINCQVRGFFYVKVVISFFKQHKRKKLKPSIEERKEETMLHYSIIFFIIAIIAGVLGFGGIAGSAVSIAKILFVVFLILTVVSFLFGRKK